MKNINYGILIVYQDTIRLKNYNKNRRSLYLSIKKKISKLSF